MDKFINQYSKRPYVCFWAIEIMYETLWAHVNRTADGNIFEELIRFDSESKITKFISVLMNKNIGNLKITVDNAEIRKIL